MALALAVVAGCSAEDGTLAEPEPIAEPAHLRFRIVTAMVEDISGIDREDVSEPTEDSSGESTGGTDAADQSADDPSVDLQAVYDELGEETVAAAENLTGPDVDAETLALLTPFGYLSGDEVAVLPFEMQYNVPTIGCEQLNARPADSVTQPDADVVACNAPDPTAVADGTEVRTKYLLAPAEVTGDDVSSAEAIRDEFNPSYFTVTVQFTNEGGEAWQELTQANIGAQVGMVVDNEVVVAPVIQEASSGSTQISGQFTADEAELLAARINAGARE